MYSDIVIYDSMASFIYLEFVLRELTVENAVNSAHGSAHGVGKRCVSTRTVNSAEGRLPTCAVLLRLAAVRLVRLQLIDFFRYQLDPADSFYQYARPGCLYTS